MDDRPVDLDDIKELRKGIDDADTMLLKSLGMRLKAVRMLKKVKKYLKQPTIDEAREEDIKAKWKANAKKLEIPEELALLMLDFILAESRRMQGA